MRILITGSRTWTNRDTILNALIDAARGVPYDEVTVIHGGAKGADTLAADVAHGLGMNVEIHMANWSEYHRAAGPIRNQEMVDSGADVCLAFFMPNSKGTADCVGRARKAKIKVIAYYDGVLLG